MPRADLADASVRVRLGGERARVLQLAKAVSTGNWSLVARVVRGAAGGVSEAGWNAAGLEALRLWLEDVRGDQERFYSRAERFGLDHRLTPRQLERAAAQAALPIRPSLAVALTAMALMGR